jgi:predicted O-methyltransferase YrrM
LTEDSSTALDWTSEFDRLVADIADTPIMSVGQGRRIWEHFLRWQPADVLDIGTCYGASAAYMAGALRRLGRGRVVTVDSNQFDARSPAKEWVAAVLERCGLTDWVETVRIPDSSYAWWLLEEVRRRTLPDGTCDPGFDFIYIDGAKSLTIDATSVVLAELLLRPGGWLLLDDLNWVYEDRPEFQPTVVMGNGDKYEMSEAERRTPHVAAIFDHIIRNHPSFGNLVIDEDEQWGWAQKGVTGGRLMTVKTTLTDEVPGRVLLGAAAKKALSKASRTFRS